MQSFKLLDTPDVPEILKNIFELFGENNVPICVFGGYLRDLIILGHNKNSQDIDIRLPLNEWCEEFPREFRAAFRLSAGHQRFLERMINAKKMPTNPAFVYRVDESVKTHILPYIFYGTDHPPLELILMQDFVPAPEDAPNADLGICQISSDGFDFYATDAFLRDKIDKTLTVINCADTRSAWQSIRRIRRFQAGSYADYKAVWPEEFVHIRDAALTEFDETT